MSVRILPSNTGDSLLSQPVNISTINSLLIRWPTVIRTDSGHITPTRFHLMAINIMSMKMLTGKLIIQLVKVILMLSNSFQILSSDGSTVQGQLSFLSGVRQEVTTAILARWISLIMSAICSAEAKIYHIMCSLLNSVIVLV